MNQTNMGQGGDSSNESNDDVLMHVFHMTLMLTWVPPMTLFIFAHTPTMRVVGDRF